MSAASAEWGWDMSEQQPQSEDERAPGSAMERLVSEKVVVLMIAINTLAIMLRAFPYFKTHHAMPLFWLDYGCTVFFVVEMIIKIKLRGWSGYIASGWNRFDFTVVVLSSPLLLAPMLDIHGFGAILVLRTGRLLRFFRLLRFIPDVDRLQVGIRRGLKASIGVLVALALYNWALGLTACYLFGDAFPEHFGDPFRAVYSIFKVFTVEGWYELPELMTGNETSLGSWAIRVFFVFAVSTGGLLGLSMANAVFVDEMVMDNNQKLEEDVEKMRESVVSLREDMALLLDENRALRQTQQQLLARLLEVVPASAQEGHDKD